MKNHLTNLAGIVLLLCLVLQACGTPAPMPTASAPLPTSTQAPPTAAPATSTPTQPAPPTPTPEPTKIQHVTKPPEPAYLDSQTTIDCTLGRTFVSDLPVVIPASCDNPLLYYIERPVVTESKNYLPYLDIGQARLGSNRDWVFAKIDLYDDSKPTGIGDIYYFFKLDLNLDGRNSNVKLISVKNLSQDSIFWTVNGVQAWSSVDGTLTPFFDAGVGADPDLIWARRSPKAIELAFKLTIFPDPARFAWTAWTYQGALKPFDIALSVYPSDVYQIDNTCAWGFNVSAYGLINHCVRD